MEIRSPRTGLKSVAVRSGLWMLLIAFLVGSVWSVLPSKSPFGLRELAAQDKGDEKKDEKEAADAVPSENPFPGRFPAPSLEGGVEWLNTAGEISLKDLRGKVVLLDFWTYCCINCIHVLPDLKKLEEKYDKQLVVIGVHHPKFENERDTENIRRAILRYEISHPVVNDANRVIAEKYQFSSWPTLVLIDPEGNFVGQQPGEGTGELFDMVIGKMIAYHRAKGTLDETPVRFALERAKAEPTPLRFPGKILTDVAGDRLFVSDSNHNRIVVSSLSGQLKEVIGSGAIGRKDGDYATAEFDHPQGMALVDDVLYVADTENHLLRAVDLKARTVTTKAGTGVQSKSREAGGPLLRTALNSPWALTYLDGKLYVAMAGPHQLWSWELGSNDIRVFAGSGREDILDGTRAEAALAQPSGITTDGKVLYHVDSEGSAVRRVTLGGKGRVDTVAGPRDFPRGRSLFEFGDVDGRGATVRMQHPLDVLFHDGKLFVADTYNHKIKVIDPKTEATATWLGTGKRGAGLSPVELSEPAGLAIAGDQLLVADTNNHRLLSVDLKTKATREFVINGLTPPAPPQPREENDGLAPVELPAIAAKAGETLTLTLDFTLPPAHKLNPLGPVSYRLKAVGTATAVDSAVLGARHDGSGEGSTGTIELPLAATPGKGTYELTMNYTYCREGTEAVCRFGRQKWKVTITTSADGSTKPVAIPVRVAMN
ncbi:thioredoxin-like domain-containing protein [Planctomyces sp. SH-PL14]|uniref:thioredoxin-like domain-containing protein n=1 Tax=Planctomyces sp. SH-PL14 TaxID=1632864 RepID=UPI00078CAD72|nr:thioredoxin-like domain-containing protein [Planctomyces sp. SH-PL14]AMV21689.1 Thiol-disulfide oxidoreductase YkuV [Planctomyces sp. SH-PL14]